MHRKRTETWCWFSLTGTHFLKLTLNSKWNKSFLPVSLLSLLTHHFHWKPPLSFLHSLVLLVPFVCFCICLLMPSLILFFASPRSFWRFSFSYFSSFFWKKEKPEKSQFDFFFETISTMSNKSSSIVLSFTRQRRKSYFHTVKSIWQCPITSHDLPLSRMVSVRWDSHWSKYQSNDTDDKSNRAQKSKKECLQEWKRNRERAEKDETDKKLSDLKYVCFQLYVLCEGVSLASEQIHKSSIDLSVIW